MQRHVRGNWKRPMLLVGLWCLWRQACLGNFVAGSRPWREVPRGRQETSMFAVARPSQTGPSDFDRALLLELQALKALDSASFPDLSGRRGAANARAEALSTLERMEVTLFRANGSYEGLTQKQLKTLATELYSKDSVALIQQYVMSLIQPWDHLVRDYSLTLALFQLAQVYWTSSIFGFSLRQAELRFALEKSVGEDSAESWLVSWVTLPATPNANNNANNPSIAVGFFQSAFSDPVRGPRPMEHYVDVVLLSGQSARVWGTLDLTVYELRQNAQHQLQVNLLELFWGDRKLEPWKSLRDLELGAVVSASDAGVLWGDPLSGPLERLELPEVREVQISADAFAALKADGSVYAWGGFFSGGHLGAARHELHQVKQIEASHRAFAALRDDGRVVTWGDVVFGGDSSEVEDELFEVCQLKATRRAFAARRRDGRVVCWGDAAFGADPGHVEALLTDVVDLFATDRAFAALTATGQVIAWGDAAYGGTGQLSHVEMVQASQRAFAAYSKQLGVVSWGDPDFGGDSRCLNLGDARVLEMSATAGAFAALLDTGSVLCWGHRDLGGRGPGLDGLDGVTRLVATNGAFAAVLGEQVVTWGSVFAGGDPEACASLGRVEDLKGSASSFLALSEGELIAWGRGVASDSGDEEREIPLIPGDLGSAVPAVPVELRDFAVEVDGSLSDYVTKLGTEEVSLLSSGMSLETHQAIEDQVAQLYGDPFELWQRLQAVLGPVTGSEADLQRLRQSMRDGQARFGVAMALESEGREFRNSRYQELWHFSGRLARHFQALGLAAEGENCGRCPRPIAVFLPPGRVWYSACVAAWRLGIPVVPLVDDLSKPEQQRRAERAFAELLPQAVLGAPSTPLEPVPDCCSLSLEQLLEILGESSDAAADVPTVPMVPIAGDTMLCYVYTGGMGWFQRFKT
eukprot:s4466_g2.t1